MTYDVIIVGAGIAGLRLAGLLEARGFSICLIDKQDRIGGKIGTDELDGFLLDRGFQVLLPHYPAARACFDYQALDLTYFNCGAKLYTDAGMQGFVSPLHHPQVFLSDVSFVKAHWRDLWRLSMDFASLNIVKPVDYALKQSESSLNDFFNARFSQSFIKLFLRPFFAGILSDPLLQSSCRLYYFYLLCFLFGGAALPSKGMQALPKYLFDRLTRTELMLNEDVVAYGKGAVTLASGSTIQAKDIVFACPHPLLTGHVTLPTSYSQLCTYYFAYTGPLDRQQSLILSAKSDTVLNHVCVPSHVASHYASSGHLISATALGLTADFASYLPKITAELVEMLGLDAQVLRFLRAYPIQKVLPVSNTFSSQILQLDQPGLHVTGDWCYQGSIHGALYSADRCAAQITCDLF